MTNNFGIFIDFHWKNYKDKINFKNPYNGLYLVLIIVVMTNEILK